MPLSKSKLAKIKKEKRVEYVRSVAITDYPHSPFLDHNWNEAALKYIETGDETLKLQFPSTPRR